MCVQNLALGPRAPAAAPTGTWPRLFPGTSPPSCAVAFPFLTLRNASCLRITCKDMREAVAEAPWEDAKTRVCHLRRFHAAFPRARAVNLSGAGSVQLRGDPHIDAMRVKPGDMELLRTVATIDLSDQSSLDDASLGKLASVRKLSLGWRLGSGDWRGRALLGVTDAGLLQLPSCLRELELGGGLAHITGAGFAKMCGLESLSLRGCRIEAANMAFLASLTSLCSESWHMPGISPGDEDMGALAGAAPGRLHQLAIVQTEQAEFDEVERRLTDEGLRRCKGLVAFSLRHVQVLGLHMNVQQAITAAGLAHLNGTLRELELPQMTDAIVAAVASALETLVLPDRCDAVTVRSLAACKRLRSLTAPQWASFAGAISAVAGSLRVLRVPAAPGLSAIDLAPLAGSGLTELDASCATVDDAGLAAALASCTQLRRLTLRGCRKLTGAFLAGCASLEELDLTDCSGVGGAAPLAGLTRLRKLQYRGSGITPAAIKDLAEKQRLAYAQSS